MSRVKVTVRSDASATALVGGLVPPFAPAGGSPHAGAPRLRAVVEALVRFTLDHAYPDDPWGEIEVTLEAGAGGTSIDVHDWGLPLASAGGEAGPPPTPVAHPVGDPPPAPLEHVPHSAAADQRDAIQIRGAGADDAEGIARLLYEN